MDVTSLTALLLTYRYWIVFPIAVFEGPILSFFIGTLCALGYFNPFLVYPILVSGDLIPDTVLYYIGRRGQRGQIIEKYGRKIGITDDNVAPIQHMWDTHPRKMMAIAKLALGLSTPFLVMAGLSGIRPRIYFGVAIPIALMQHIVLISLGYYFGNSYALVKRYMGHAEFLVIAIILFGGAYFLFARFMRKRFFEAEKEDLV